MNPEKSSASLALQDLFMSTDDGPFYTQQVIIRCFKRVHSVRVQPSHLPSMKNSFSVTPFTVYHT